MKCTFGLRISHFSLAFHSVFAAAAVFAKSGEKSFINAPREEKKIRLAKAIEVQCTSLSFTFTLSELCEG